MKKQNTMYEFNGCYFHGHPCKYELWNEEKMKRTNKKKEFIEKLGFKLITFWECDYTKLSKSNRDIANYLNKRKLYYENMEKIA